MRYMSNEKLLKLFKFLYEKSGKYVPYDFVFTNLHKNNAEPIHIGSVGIYQEDIRYGTIPDNLVVHGNCRFYSCENFDKMPKNLEVTGYLYLISTSIYPDTPLNNLKVSKQIYVKYNEIDEWSKKYPQFNFSS